MVLLKPTGKWITPFDILCTLLHEPMHPFLGEPILGINILSSHCGYFPSSKYKTLPN